MIRHLLLQQQNPRQTALIENDRSVCYGDLRQKADRLYPLLAPAVEEKTSEIIAILLPNGSDYIAAYWGVMALGLTAFPLNILMTPHEMVPLLQYASVKTLITATAYRRRLTEMTEFAALSLNIIYMDALEPLPHGKDVPAVAVNPDAPMVLLNTSGTTGKYKIVQLSENNVAACVAGYLDKLQCAKWDVKQIRFMLAAPFSSVYGLMILSACLRQAFPLVMPEPLFTLDSLFRTADKHKVTHYEGSTSTILLMAEWIGKPIPYHIDALCYFGTGGSPVSGRLIEKLQNAYAGKAFFHGYGMTEASPLITKHPCAKVIKTDSVGTAIKGLEIRVVSGQQMVNTCYTRGEIVVKGPSVMLGYYRNEAETQQVLKDGYLYTGDIGYLDEEGYLYVCGRKKNIIIVRGFKVYPEEVEECLQNSMLVKECKVYGQPDILGNEQVCAAIVPLHTPVEAETFKAYCEKHLAEYKRPHQIFIVESLKKNLSGKIERGKEGSV